MQQWKYIKGCAICAPHPCANFWSVLITYSSGLSSQEVEIFQSSCYCHHPWSQGPKWVVEKMARHTGSEATSVKLGKADCSSALAYRTVSRYSAFSELETMNTVVQELRVYAIKSNVKGVRLRRLQGLTVPTTVVGTLQHRRLAL